MKRQKRNRLTNAFNKGFKAGARGHSEMECPYATNLSNRGQWFGGWREGRKHYLSGYLS